MAQPMVVTPVENEEKIYSVPHIQTGRGFGRVCLLYTKKTGEIGTETNYGTAPATVELLYRKAQRIYVRGSKAARQPAG